MLEPLTVQARESGEHSWLECEAAVLGGARGAIMHETQHSLTFAARGVQAKLEETKYCQPVMPLLPGNLLSKVTRF